MAEKGIRGRICQTTFMLHSYVKGNNKDFDKNKDLSYLKYLEINNCMDGQRCKSYLQLGLSWLKKHLNLMSTS